MGVEQWAAYVDEDKDYSKWTVLREGDGGKHVHELQTALVQQGFWPGEDDMLWWQFGSDTCSAVQTFQVCNLPVCSYLYLVLLALFNMKEYTWQQAPQRVGHQVCMPAAYKQQ